MRNKERIKARIARYEAVLASYEKYPDPESEDNYKDLLAIDRKALSLLR